MKALNLSLLITLLVGYANAEAKDYSVCAPYYAEGKNIPAALDLCFEELDKLKRKALKAPGCSKLIELDNTREFHEAYERALIMEKEAGEDTTGKSIIADNANCEDEVDALYLGMAFESGWLDELKYYIQNP